MTSEPAAIGITELRGPTFEWRAATTFKVVVAFEATITVIVVAGTGQFPPAYLVVASMARPRRGAHDHTPRAFRA